MHLAQNSDSDLVLTLHNTTAHAVTNRFPVSEFFQGVFTIVQPGEVPIRAYDPEYLNIILHAFPVRPPPRTIKPSGAIRYTVALQNLVLNFGESGLAESKPVLIFATMRDFDLTSNAIILKHPENILSQGACLLGTKAAPAADASGQPEN